MKKKALVAVIVVLCCVLGCCGLVLAGCGSSSSEDQFGSNAGVSDSNLAPTVPASHEVRMQNLTKSKSSAACYGCHGASEDANPMLHGINAMPDTHYVNEDPSTLQLSPQYSGTCYTCHVLANEDEDDD